MKIHLTYILLLLAITVAAFYFYDQSRKHQAESDRKDSIIAEKNAEIKYHVSVTGRVIAEKQAAQATTKEALEAYSEVISQIRKEFDIKTRDIKAFVQASFQAQGSGEATVVNNYYQDSTGRTVRAKKFLFDDKYLHFESELYDSLQTAFSTYTYSDSILLAFHGKKKWFLGKETLYASAMLSNPNAKVTSSTSVLIKEARDKRWSVGVSVGWGLVKVGDDVHTGWFLGPSIEYVLFKF